MRWTSRPFGTFLSMRSRNEINSTARCAVVVVAITFPDATLSVPSH